MRHVKLTLAGIALALLTLAAAHLTAAEYIVDQADPAAADANPGTAARPLKTIQAAAARVRAGDTVTVMAGSYEGRVTFAPEASGTEQAPITFRGLPRHTVTMQGFDTKNCHHLRIEGFTITPAVVENRTQSNGILVASNGVAIIDNLFVKNRWVPVSGRSYAKDGFSKATGTRVAFNEVRECSFGFYISGRDWVVERNQVTRMQRLMDGADCDYTRPFGVGHVVRDNRFHGSTRKEIGKSHIDGAQYYNVNDDYIADVTYERNVILDAGQPIYIPNGGKKTKKETKDIRIIGNIISHTPGGDIRSSKAVSMTYIPNAVVSNNTIYDTLYFGIAIHYCPDAAIRANIMSKTPDMSYGGKDLERLDNDYNLAHEARKPQVKPGPHDLIGQNPMFVDAARLNFRLKAGSPAIGAGPDGTTIGALPYPNIYYVDSRHPGADDEGFGYPGWPFRTVAAALAMAKPGETIVLRGSVYRECIAPAGGLTVRAAEGETVTVSGADLVTGWERDGEGWSAPLAKAPVRLLRDGEAWDGATYDAAAKRLHVTGFDPRRHVIETVVRDHAILLPAAGEVTVEGLKTVATLGEAVAPAPPAGTAAP